MGILIRFQRVQTNFSEIFSNYIFLLFSHFHFPIVINYKMFSFTQFNYYSNTEQMYTPKTRVDLSHCITHVRTVILRSPSCSLDMEVKHCLKENLNIFFLNFFCIFFSFQLMLVLWICGNFHHCTKRPQNRGQKSALYF